MAQENNQATQALANIYRTPELWSKITFTLLCLVIYRGSAHHGARHRRAGTDGLLPAPEQRGC
jgi:hypothetical protein